MKTIVRPFLVGLLLLLSGFALAKDQVTLRFTVWDGDEALKVLRRVLVDFERDNPDIKVKLENFGDYNLYHQKMLVQYAANVAPDVAMMDQGHFQALAKRGALLPLNQFFPTTPGFDIKEYYQSIVGAMSLNGNVYTLPRDIAPMGLVYYNKKAFDEAHLPYPDGTWTWDFKERPELKEKDFIWVCDQLTKRGADGKVVRWAFASGWPELLAQIFAYSSGGHQADNNETPTKVLTSQPNYIRAYQYASDFMNTLRYMPNSTETSGVLMQTTQQLFVAQKIAMFTTGIWEVPQIRRDMKPGSKDFFEWDIALFPGYVDGTRRTPTGGSGYSVFSSTKYPEQSWRLTRYMAGPHGMTAMAQAGIAQPAIRSLALTKDVWLPGPNTTKEQYYPPSRIVTDVAAKYVDFGPTADYWPSISDRLGAGLDLIWSGQSRAEPVMIWAAKSGQERLDTILKEEKLSPFNWTYGLIVAALIVAIILYFVYGPEKAHRYTNRQKLESRSAYRFMTPWLIGIVVFTLGPMILSFLMSFADWDIIRAAKWRGAQNYIEAGVIDPLFWKSMKVTFIYTFASVPIGLFGSLMLALLMNQKVKGIPLFRAMYYVPSLASGVAAALVFRKIFNPDQGLLNSILYGSHDSWVGQSISRYAGTPTQHVDWLGNEKTALPAIIFMSLWGIGGGMVILLAGLQGIPQYYYEAATLDGAGIMGKFKSVTLPLLTPTLFFSLVTGIIGSFQAFTSIFVIANGGGGPNDATRLLMLHMYKLAFESLRMGYSSALAWILFVIIMIFTLIQVKMSKRWVYYEADAK